MSEWPHAGEDTDVNPAGHTDNIQIIITGSPDSLESATLRRAISLADREQRPHSADPLWTQSAEGTIPPPGGIDLAVDATDKMPGEVLRRIADRAGIPVDESTKPTTELLDSLPPMTMVVYGIDDSQKPDALLTEVLKPLADRNHRLLLTFRRKSSSSLSIARSSWPDSVLLVSHPVGPEPDTSDEEPPSTKEWMCAGLVPLPVLDLPDPATRVLANPTDSEQGKLSAGDLVAGRYEVVGCLARGGLGWVYLARDTHLDGHYVALKGLINTSASWALALAATERRFLTTLDHPNIVRIFDFVTHTPEPHADKPIEYIVMEYVDGLPLDKIRENATDHQNPLGEPLLAEHVIAYGIEILDAFDYLHRHKMLYCDMKPSNVIRSANRIKIIDLGAARWIGDRSHPIVQTPGFGVEREEIRERHLTVQSDIHTVGKTLGNLFSVTSDAPKPDAEPDSSPISLGIESFRRALERATHEEADRRFPSAAAMSQQLRGVLREILSLRDGKPRAEPSTVFTATAALLDAGLGMVPPLDNWTNRAVERDATLDAGRPSAVATAAGLPVPQVDADDPAVNFLATVSTTDLRWLIDQLATFPHKSIEIQLRCCRAHLELENLEEAQGCLGSAEEILGSTADYDWRIAWHHGLLALANDEITDAESRFADVYRALPGEDAPKLALGFCCEKLGKPVKAERYYEAVWRRDRSQASAAFGLARIHLQRGNRNGAVAILDEVPDVSRHYDAARIAAVRILSGRLPAGTGSSDGLPTVTDFTAVVSRLPILNLDGGDVEGPARDRLTAAVREIALDWVRKTGGDEQLHGDGILGNPVRERGLRKLLEESFRALAARQASNRTDRGVLIDLANAVRRSTLW